MNLWSVASVAMDPHVDPYKPGTVRVVHVKKFGMTLNLEEETVESVPPHCYRYRVRPNVLVRAHRAEQLLASTGTKTELTWQVDICSWVPGLMWILVRTMRSQLEESLDRLEAVVREAHGLNPEPSQER